MNSERINDWVQSITAVAIVIGIVLVILELQQNRELAQSQLTSDGFGMISQARTSILGESPAEALAKACDNPESLSTADYIVLKHYFEGILSDSVGRLYWLSRRGSFVSDDYWKTGSNAELRLIFGNPAGRAWWRQANLIPPEIKSVGDELLNARQPRPCISSGWKRLTVEEASRSVGAD